MKEVKIMSEKQSVGRKDSQEKSLDSSQGKRTFTKPKLTKHGDATKITASPLNLVITTITPV